jgi:hypothetical protein
LPKSGFSATDSVAMTSLMMLFPGGLVQDVEQVEQEPHPSEALIVLFRSAGLTPPRVQTDPRGQRRSSSMSYRVSSVTVSELFDVT